MGKGLSITAFVLSILFFIPFAPLIGLILGIVAFVKSKDDPNALRGLALASIIIGSIITIIGAFMLFGMISGFQSAISAREGFDYVEPQGFDKQDFGTVINYFTYDENENVKSIISIMPPNQILPYNQLWQDMKNIDNNDCDSASYELNQNIVYNGINGQQLITTCQEGTKKLIINRVSLIKEDKQVGFSLTSETSDYDNDLRIFEEVLNSVDWK
jgi:hypothetical protein